MFDQNAVFLSDDGTPIRDPGRAFCSALKRAGIKRHLRLHDLRHSALSHWARLGLAPSVVQKIAGYATPQMTSRYINFDREEMVFAGAPSGKGHANDRVGIMKSHKIWPAR